MINIENKLNYKFKNKKLLKQALTHKSAIGSANNERLEFLGDAVLKLVISEYLYENHENLSEGEMTKIRAFVISDNTLAKIAAEINLGYKISLSGGEKKAGGSKRKSIIGDALEAIFGAIYLDSGYEDAKKTIISLLKKEMKDVYKNGPSDFKSELQEITQKAKINLPEYIIEKETGPEHNKEFHVSCTISINNKTITAKGIGKNKKAAEQNCAQDILSKLNS